MFDGLRTIIYPATDLAASKAWFSDVLGFGPYFDEPFYVGFNVGGYELGLLPAGDDGSGDGPSRTGASPTPTPPTPRCSPRARPEHVPVSEVGDGIKTGTVRAPDGYVIGVIYNPHFSLPA